VTIGGGLNVRSAPDCGGAQRAERLEGVDVDEVDLAVMRDFNS